MQAVTAEGRRRARSFVTFALFLLCLTVWALASPMYASPDEPEHVVKAYAVVHADFGVRNEDGAREYRVPAAYTGRAPCYAFKSDRPANCLHLSSDGRTHLQSTKADTYPPFFYLLVGWPSLLTGGVVGLYLMRIVTSVCVAALLALAFDSLRALPNRGPLFAGAALAVTPAIFFFGASVNPSGVAVAAAMAVWTGGFALLRSERLADSRLALAKIGGPLCLFLLLRRDSLLWGGLIILILLVMAPPARRRELASLRATWAWAAAAVAAAVVQLATSSSGASDLILQESSGSVSRAWSELPSYIREVGGGILGWRDTPLPNFVYDVFIGGAVVLVVVALAAGPRRIAVAVASVTAAVVAAPLIIGAFTHPYFQGRYMLPLSIGVVLLGGLALSESTRAKPWPTWASALALAFVAAAQISAFAQTLRRHSDGLTGDWFFTDKPAWQPPLLDATSLTILYAATVIGLTAWVVALSSYDARRSSTGVPLVRV